MGKQARIKAERAAIRAQLDDARSGVTDDSVAPTPTATVVTQARRQRHELRHEAWYRRTAATRSSRVSRVLGLLRRDTPKP